MRQVSTWTRYRRCSPAFGLVFSCQTGQASAGCLIERNQHLRRSSVSLNSGEKPFDLRAATGFATDEN